MKKLINKISGKSPLIVLLVVFFTVSCSKDFLELQPQQSVSTANALSTVGDFQAAITGGYDGLSSSNYYGRYFTLVTDIMSDDVKLNASANRASDWAEYVGSSTDNNNLSGNIWEYGYRVVDRANRILSMETEASVDTYKGQAYALRALVHFDLVRIYGQHYTYTADASHLGIPIVTEVDPFQKPARNTVAEVYAQVIADFNAALGLIGDDSDSHFMNRNAVKALLARVYMFKEDWSNALSAANDVINSGDYSLVSNANYADIFIQDGHSGAIFELDMNETDKRGTDALGGMYLGSGYGDYLPAEDILNLFPADDVRGTLFATDLSIGGGIYGTTRVNKYASDLGYNNPQVIRLADVYLIRAEANYNLGNASAAQADVDMVRQRANPTAADVTATGQALLDEILLERRLELCFEGSRLWDLTRHKMGVYRTDCTATICDISYPSDRFILAVGKFEMDVNENMVQNPGYGN
jgi:starch-binding outer membrane protein, SusD/RagB family